MKRPLSDIIGRKLLIHLYRTATTTLEKHSSRLVIRGYLTNAHQQKAEYNYGLNVSIHPMHAFNYKFITVLLVVSDSELLINISDCGNKTLNIADKEAIDRITQFVQEVCETIVK